MRKKTQAKHSNGSALDFLRGGKTVPQAFIRQRMAAANHEIAAHYKGGGLQQQAAKYFRQIQEPIRPINDDPKAARGAEGLLGIHKKLAKQKLVLPSVVGELGGLLSGRFAAKFTPPFDYAFTLPFLTFGTPQLIGSANKNTGELSNRAVTDFAKPSFGTMYTELGVYFHPFFGPATLRVSANPTYSRQWWTNSLRADSDVRSFGSVVVGMFGQQGRVGPTSGNVAIADIWDEQSTEQVKFDLGSSPSIPATAQLDVNPSFSYSVFVAVTTNVRGVGWPGSLAGSIISLIVPSITIELDLIPVASQG